MTDPNEDDDHARKALFAKLSVVKSTAHALHQTFAEAAEKFGYISQAADDICDGYQAISGTQSPDAYEYTVSGLKLMSALESQLGHLSGALDLSLVDPLAANMELTWRGVASSGSALAVPGFSTTAKPCPFLPGADPERYANKLATLDAALAASYRQAWSSRYAATDDPERVGLWELRQVYDHLIGALAPDDAVRSSKHWSKKGDDKPNAIYRVERLAYAADAHVADANQRAILQASASDMVKTYGKLNQAHERGTLSADSARATFDAMDNIIRAWLDAIIP